MAKKPYASLIKSALEDLREFSAGLPDGGAKIPSSFRNLDSSASKLFSQAGMNPDYFENWWWLVNTLADIHFYPQRTEGGWSHALHDELLEALAFLKVRHPSLSTPALCSRLVSNKHITGLQLSEALRRKIGATKTSSALYRQFRYAIRELESAQKAGLTDLFAPVRLLKILLPKKMKQRGRT